MKIGIAHPSTIASYITYLNQDYASGVSSVLVKNIDGFIANKFACLGPVGFIQTELIGLDTVTAPQTFALHAATAFAHNGDDKVTLFDFDQIHIYKSTTGINGVYNLATTTGINVSDDFTVYEDTAALTTYYYKFAYYNSLTSVESDLSDPIAATGFVFHSLKTMTDRVLSAFGDINGKFVTRDEVKDSINEFYEMAQQEYSIVTKRLNLSSQQFTVQPQVDTYPLNADFMMEKAVKFSQDGGVTFPFYGASKQVDSTGSVIQTNFKYGYWIDGGSMIIDDPIPSNNTDVAKVLYVATPTTLQLQTDTLSTPFTNCSGWFVKYGLAYCYLKNKKFDEWKALTAYAEGKLEKFLSFTKRMQNLHSTWTEIQDTSRF